MTEQEQLVYLQDQLNVQNEMIELVCKAGRRCCYDLAHAVSLLPESEYDYWKAREVGWRTLFESGTEVKDYRHRLHLEVDRLLREVEKLQKLLVENGIELPDNPDIPF